jgi:hypothetical protein
MKRLLPALLGLGIALAPLTMAHADTAPGPGYLTIQFGRSIEGSYSKCGTAVPGILTLAQIAADLQTRNLTATSTVVVDNTGSTTELCNGGDVYADWADLQGLNADYGWQVVSDGLTHDDIVGMTVEGQEAETCGTLPTFAAEGFTDAWGLYAYGNEKRSSPIQKNIVATCYGYGRTYRGGVNYRALMVKPFWQNTNSITGGACNDPSMPCYAPQLAEKGNHYMSPVRFENMVAHETGDQWIDLQFYKLVSGAQSDGKFSWDCTSTDWTQHWTGQPELYCQNDFDAILNSVPTGIVSADPATVATAWSR